MNDDDAAVLVLGLPLPRPFLWEAAAAALAVDETLEARDCRLTGVLVPLGRPPFFFSLLTVDDLLPTGRPRLAWAGVTGREPGEEPRELRPSPPSSTFEYLGCLALRDLKTKNFG